MELIGVGIDLVDIARVERMIERFGERAISRFLTGPEQGYVMGRARPAMHVAARIAAKEAAYKAFQALPGARAIGWHDFEVQRETEGRPFLVLHGRARTIAAGHAPLEIQLSLSHSDATAGAVAVLMLHAPLEIQLSLSHSDATAGAVAVLMRARPGEQS